MLSYLSTNTYCFSVSFRKVNKLHCPGCSQEAEPPRSGANNNGSPDDSTEGKYDSDSGLDNDLSDTDSISSETDSDSSEAKPNGES